MAKMTKKGRGFVSDEISHLMKDGPSKGPQKGKKMPKKQAIAVALEVADRKGFKSSSSPKTAHTETFDSREETMSIFDNLIQEVGPWKRAKTAYGLARRGGAPVGNAVGHGVVALAGGADPGKPGTFGKTTRDLRNRRRDQGWNKPSSSSSSSTPPAPRPAAPASAPEPFKRGAELDRKYSSFDNFGDDFSTEVSPPQSFKSLDQEPARRPHISTEIIPRPPKSAEQKPTTSHTYEDHKLMSMFDNIIESKRPKSQFDAIVESNRAPAKSQFDAIVENQATSSNWDDRVARTLNLADELVGIRNQVTK